ncbi:MAG: hypothetical protein F4114_16665 [Rhodospirillaceae bacterium]|nr:hypothetical protein [Rhodospirillaceae bacterium]MYI50702.1 hypothetical protein [Rhodospirillaceae bacterium]
MASKIWTNRVSKTMKVIGEEFCDNELAYLALTSKVERPIVDKLAFCLHRDYEKFDVAREWTKPNEIQRVDLAVLDHNSPRLLLEAKAMYGFDMFSSDANKRKYRCRVKKDVKKLTKFRPNYVVERTAMILLTDTNCCVNDKFSQVVKYLRKLQGPAISFDKLKYEVEDNFKCRPIHSSGSICAGYEFGVNVTVHYWLFGPFSAEE